MERPGSAIKVHSPAALALLLGSDDEIRRTSIVAKKKIKTPRPVTPPVHAISTSNRRKSTVMPPLDIPRPSTSRPMSSRLISSRSQLNSGGNMSRPGTSYRNISARNGTSGTSRPGTSRPSHPQTTGSLESSISAINENQISNLCNACTDGKLDVVRSIVVNNPSMLSKPNRLGNYPLHCACMKGKIEVVNFLLRMGHDLESKNNNGETALHTTVETSQSAILEILLDFGAEINVQDDYAQTPLMLAVMRKKSDIVTILLNFGADVYIKDDLGDTVFDFATKPIEKLIKNHLGPKLDISMNRLPYNALKKLFSFFDIKDLGVSSTVCWRWNREAKQSEHWKAHGIRRNEKRMQSVVAGQFTTPADMFVRKPPKPTRKSQVNSARRRSSSSVSTVSSIISSISNNKQITRSVSADITEDIKPRPYLASVLSRKSVQSVDSSRRNSVGQDSKEPSSSRSVFGFTGDFGEEIDL
eukprot:TRINITY_DN1576_c0_g2_i1.p1 TRINITY_DN1576_c0_g2~~TRINITY_DN1576_c0_g2_i1.p1  ORF type:complete len:471 (+),score=113.74 TRINITY_DN1576_c0_g2_i1:113-1525(+)